MRRCRSADAHDSPVVAQPAPSASRRPSLTFVPEEFDTAEMHYAGRTGNGAATYRKWLASAAT